MQAWKPLLIVVPAGLTLGAIGGHYARPVMTQAADDGSLQAAFETRGQRYGTAEQTPPADPAYDVGGYSYPPYLDDPMIGGDREITGWQGPSFADWPQYRPERTPSTAQLEAQVAARDAALGRRAWGDPDPGTDDPSPAAAAAQAAADVATNPADEFRSSNAGGQGLAGGPKVVTLSPAASGATSAEPHTADSSLPAIW